MKRAVLDTNIVISSALGGALVLVLEKWDQGKFTVIITSDILSEYFEVLNRPKFKLKQETIDKNHPLHLSIFRIRCSGRTNPFRGSRSKG
jgi:predicted nucleic acid-binding protein